MSRTLAAVSLVVVLSGCASAPSTRPVGDSTEAVERAGRSPLRAMLSEVAPSPDAVGESGYRDYLAKRQALHRNAHAFHAPAAATPSVALSSATDDNGVLELHFIDVGQGDSTLIVCPNGNTILVDAGSAESGDPEMVRDYLLERLHPDSPKLDTLVITHADFDHYGLLPFVLQSVEVGSVVHVGARDHYAVENVFGGFRMSQWLDSVSGITTKLTASQYDQPGSPSALFDCGAADIYVLAADVRATESWKNARSIVLKVSYGAFDAILTGDATKDTERVILQRYDASWLASEVLKIGHHGSLETSTSVAWADAVRPSLAIASAGWENGFGHPRSEVVQRLEEHTGAWEPHRMVSATGKKGAYTWHDEPAYEMAVFTTQVNGTVVVLGLSDGGYDVEWFDYE